jgi:hypothetical protein
MLQGLARRAVRTCHLASRGATSHSQSGSLDRATRRGGPVLSRQETHWRRAIRYAAKHVYREVVRGVVPRSHVSSPGMFRCGGRCGGRGGVHLRKHPGGLHAGRCHANHDTGSTDIQSAGAGGSDTAGVRSPNASLKLAHIIMSANSSPLARTTSRHPSCGYGFQS